MKNTIGQRILAVILAPSILVFALLLAFTAYASARYVSVWAELELKSVSEINAADLSGRVDSMRISVMSAASVLDTINPSDGDGRARAENVVKSMFQNPHVYNAWLAFEPDAFDGMDVRHASDYPGAPSGRFIRSYVIDDGQVVTAPDMDETTLDDPDESPWYVSPRDTGSFYIDASNDVLNMYDYGLGDGPICTMAFAAPVYRDGSVIGCVGADMSFDVATLDAGKTGQAAAAVFHPNGRVFFAQDAAFANDSIETLGFTEAPEIISAFSAGRDLFLPSQYSAFIDSEAFTYFRPVPVSDRDNLYLYTAMPLSAALRSLEPVFMMIAVMVAAVIIFVLFIIIHVKRKISNPLKALILAADAVSQGNLETEIPSFPESKDEIGVLSLSLHRMAEQFRIYIMRLEQTQKETAIHAKLDELFAAGGLTDVTNGVLSLLCDNLGVDKAVAVRLSDGVVQKFYRDGHAAETGVELPHDFPHHAQITPMLAGKKLLFMNPYIISEQNADFLDKGTRFACILPLRENRRALGYIILESKSEKTPFGMSAEAILCGVAEALSDFIKKEEKNTENLESAQEGTPETSGAEVSSGSPFDVEGLDSSAAIQAMGGMAELYEQALKLMTSLLPETIERLDSLVGSDMGAFSIEIHGLKGSLNNVGAYEMGSFAARVEQAAKAGDDSLCAELYASFRDSLTEFYHRLIKAFEFECGKLPGNILELVALLPKAEAAADGGDCGSALDMLRPAGGMSFDVESDALLEKTLAALEASEAEKAAEYIRELRERLASWEEG